jgi:hypothetical protein
VMLPDAPAMSRLSPIPRSRATHRCDFDNCF